MKKSFIIILTISLSIILLQKVHPQVGFQSGKIRVMVNEFGNIQINVPAHRNPLNIYRATALVGASPDRVFDYFNDSENEDTVKIDTLNRFSDYRIYGTFNNSDSNLPPEILVKLEVFGWKNASYALLKFNIQNKDSVPLNAIAGLEIIPQIDGTAETDTVNYLFDRGIIDIFQKSHIGFKLVSHQLSSLKMFEYFDGYENDSSFYSWLTHGTIDQYFTANDTSDTANDTLFDNGAVLIASQSPVNLNIDDSLIVYYMLAYGDSLGEMITNMENAESKYIIITSVNDKKPLAALDFRLHQNYPNPFNPSTNIEFDIPGNRQFVELKVYDILGKEISTIISGYLPAGRHKFNWNAEGLSSGVYFYRLAAGSFAETKKMILLR